MVTRHQKASSCSRYSRATAANLQADGGQGERPAACGQAVRAAVLLAEQGVPRSWRSKAPFPPPSPHSSFKEDETVSGSSTSLVGTPC